MESTKNNFLSYEEAANVRESGEELNPIDRFLLDNSPLEGEEIFRTQLYEAVNYEDEEWRTERNMNVVAQFMEHCKEQGVKIPDTAFESFFDA